MADVSDGTGADEIYYLLSYDGYTAEQQLLPLDTVTIEDTVKEEDNYEQKFCTLMADIFQPDSNISMDTEEKPKVSFLLSFGDTSAEVTNDPASAEVSSNNQKYTCIECNRSCKTAYCLKLHMESHARKTRKPRYQCCNCPLTFPLRLEMKRHQKLCIGEVKHTCADCNKTYKEKSSLNSHKRLGNCVTKLRFKCSNCPKYFSQRWPMIYHQKICVGEVSNLCTKCNKCFESRSGLRNHMKLHTGKGCLKCSECGKLFVQRWQLDEHMRRHRGEKPFQCNKCEKSFTTRVNLRQHLPIHSSETPFACELCERSFKYKKSLKIHLQAHNNERPYKCNQCDKSFPNTSNLKRHSRIHNPERSLDFKCRHCDQAFLDSSACKRHEMTKHGGEKKHICTVCNSAFFTKALLIRHMRSHTNKREFKCEEPGCDFASNWSEGLLSHHKNIHLRLKPFPCPTCQKPFSCKSKLKAHENAAHNKQK